MPYYRRKKVGRKVAPKRRFARKARPTMALKKMVKNQIDRNLETKSVYFANTFVGTNNAYSSWQNIGVGVFPISPNATYCNIQQGSQSNMRVGNEIAVKKALIKMQFYPASYNATFNPNPCPQMIQIIFFKPKAQTTSTVDLQGFWQQGNTTANFYGTLLDLSQTINRDKFIYCGMKKIKLGNSIMNSSGGGGTASQFFSNNDFKMNQSLTIDVTRHLYKKYKFNDATNTPWQTPTYMLINSVNADGTATTSSVYQTIFNYSLQLYYQDG